MRFLSLLLMVFSFNAFSSSSKLHLKANDYVKFQCPETMDFKFIDNVARCVCPDTSYVQKVGNTVVCGGRCEIAVEEMTEEIYSDMGGYMYTETNDYLLVRKNKEIIYRERIYSMSSNELQLLLPEAKEVAKKYCYKTFFNGKEVKF